MRSNTLGSWPSVHRLDSRTSFRTSASRRQPRREARFREAIVDYRTLLDDSVSTSAGVDRFISACLHRWADRWSTRTLRSLSTLDVREYLADLAARGHAPSSIHQERSLLGSFYRWARRCGWAGEDPTLGVGPVRCFLDVSQVAWTASEQRLLLDACRGHGPAGRPAAPEASRRTAGSAPGPYLYPAVLLGLRTGLHSGSLLNLEWRHVDLDKERIAIPAHETRSGRLLDAPLQRDAASLLAALWRRASDLLRSPRRVLDLVRLPLAAGRPDEHKVLHSFRKARRIAGIPEGDLGSLRLSFIRNCALAGVPMEDAARMCDWEDGKVLVRTYEESGREAASI